nr:receptor-like protein kinase HSL1 [Aegilops tauschii subsp. strangulata]
MSTNKLSGAKLQKFNAGNNLFSGEIQARLVARMPLLQELVMSTNKLSGAIPASIASLGGLTQMNFSNNQFTGEIPAGLGSMPVLTLLDVSSNQLSGSIPPALGSVRLNQLNLSSNNLVGEVPEALAVSTYDRSFLGKPTLCMGPASSGNLAGVSSCAARSSEKVSPGLRTGLVAATAAALLVVIIVLAFFIVCDIKRRKGLAPLEEAWKLTQPLDFGEAAVLRGLSDENLIGKCGSGRVYCVEWSSRWEGARGTSAMPLPNGADGGGSASDDELMAAVATLVHAGELEVTPRQRRRIREGSRGVRLVRPGGLLFYSLTILQKDPRIAPY